ncbi:acetyltransferase (GNAT) family protein [Leucobacter komagatae]|uniref:Acetyltransferase (GNAT) family protein n=1 Tax=Leucobacter komagatae TaxID=55969 RepID=A0A542Y5U8_9MICO|nr:GNAT family N-acetyltransferase [Leucobacter komagatae]TQL43415.1 acetyltransferase (GNAT) family protein [Leucobacter komagatae]
MPPIEAPDAFSLYVDTHLARAGDATRSTALAWFRTGAPHEELNGVLYATAAALGDAVAEFGRTPALWHSWPERPEFDVEAQLRARGFEFVEEEPVMTLALGSGSGSPSTARPGPATVRPVETERDLAAWEEIWTGEAPNPVTLRALASAGLGTDRTVHHLLAEVDGVAVGCGAAVVAGRALAVEHIVTAASHRRRGIGSQLAEAALAVGRSHGVRHAILTASPDGAGIYERLGFEAREPVRRFIAPAATG